jgi:hypothetical protein
MDQVTNWLIVCVVPSLEVPVALYCRVEAGASNELLGATARDFRVAELTVKDAEPVALAPAKLNVAVIVVVPEAAPTARPALLPELLMVATPVLLDCQDWTLEVMSCVEESLKTPVALKVWCPPIGIVRGEGVTTTD